VKTTNMTKKKPDYEGFCKHMQAYRERGIPTGISDLIRLARHYNTPIPKINVKTGKIDFGDTLK